MNGTKPETTEVEITTGNGTKRILSKETARGWELFVDDKGHLWAVDQTGYAMRIRRYSEQTLNANGHAQGQVTAWDWKNKEVN